ncbi:MAG: TetR/AcrR family transcriptional regulator [Chloroflexi bacterium]|nr:TetR/AcrR family transcriptional regulator [Chloroflexota bacterium]
MTNNPTRQRILDKTAELLEMQGYHATGLNQIIKESGAPRGSLYYYFPEGKEELAAEAVRDNAERMVAHARQALAAVADPAEAVYQMIVGIAHHAADSGCQGGAPLAAVALEASATSERLRTVCREGYAALAVPFAEKLVGAGLPPARAERLGVFITAALEGAVILTRVQQDPAALTAVAEEIRLLIQQAV